MWGIEQVPSMCHRYHDVLRILEQELERHTGAVLAQPVMLDDMLLSARRNTVVIRRSIVGEVRGIDDQNIVFPPTDRMTFVGTLIGIGMTTSVHVHGPYLVGILNAAAATRAFSVNSRSRAVRIPQAAVLGNVPLKRHHRVHIQRSITVLARATGPASAKAAAAKTVMRLTNSPRIQLWG